MIELVIGIQSEQNLGVDDAVVLGVVRDIHFLTRTERLLKLYTAFDDEVAAFCVSLRSRPATSTK